MVFTSGIVPDTGGEAPGPTEKFIRNYGTRVHHIAFRTEEIENVVAALKGDSLSFLLDLVGSQEEGLRQIFTGPSPNTMLVTEYIQRYGGFDGFFTKSNVEKLTQATEKQ
jgi:4-hydroxyphenylpyruvate dioxygenase-like putative hemolysin